MLAVSGGVYALAEETDGRAELNQNISDLLDKLDLSELQKFLEEDKDNFLFGFGGTAREIIEYLISGNLNTDYSGYLNELFSVIFKDVINMIPAFATVTAIALLSAVVSAAEGAIIGKSSSKIVHLACYSLIILILSTMMAGIVSDCVACINNVKRQVEIITPY